MFFFLSVFLSVFLPQPAVCSRELCVYSFHTLGVMSEATDVIATGAEVGLLTFQSPAVRLVAVEALTSELVMIKSQWHICHYISSPTKKKALFKTFVKWITDPYLFFKLHIATTA